MPLAVTVLAASLIGADAHYVLVFAHQDTPVGVRPDPRKSHSFACWIRVADGQIAEEFNISWTGVYGVRFLKGAQPGRNLSLEQTLERARRRGVCVSMWGPFLVCPNAFDRARRQYERLEWGERTGGVQYNVLDAVSRSFDRRPAINCIHVLSDLTGQRLRTGGKYGVTASELIVESYHKYGVTLGRDPAAEWIWEAIRPAETQVTWRTTSKVPVVATRNALADSESSDVEDDVTNSRTTGMAP